MEHRSPGLAATNAVAALAADREVGEPFVQALWDQPIPTGQYRYYDGLLIMLGLLQVNGNFRIYEPGTAPAPEGQAFPTPKSEVDGRLAPPTGKALLLVGQGRDSVDAYFDATVTAPGGVAANIDLQLNGADWYPGDKFVDWVGMSYCDGKSIEAKIQFVGDNNDVSVCDIYQWGEESY